MASALRNQIMLLLQNLIDRITKSLLVIAAVLAFLLCFLVVADVLGRVLFNSPIKGTTELVSLTIVIICFLQTGFAIRSGGMLNVDMFTSKLGARGQCLMAAIGALAGMCFFAIICYGASDGALHAFMANEFEGEGALRVPVWPAKFVLVLGTFLASVSYFLMVIQHIAHGLRGDLPEQYSSSH